MNRKNIDIICSSVAEEFCVSVEAIVSRSQRQVHTWPRALAMHIACSRGELTADIAEYFGVSTSLVRYYVRRVTSNITYNSGDRCRYERIVRRLDALECF